MTTQARRDQLLARFRQTSEALDEFIASRTPAQQQEASQAAGWSARDLLTAIAFWMDYTVERMAYYERDEPPPRDVDFDAVQEHTLQSAAGQSWSERVVGVRRALAALVAVVERSSDAFLETDNAYGDDPGGPLWGEVQANGFSWPLEELEKYLLRAGEPRRAERIHAVLAPVAEEPEMFICALVEPAELRAWQQDAARSLVVIDVRSAADFARGHVPGARHIPLSRLAQHFTRLPRDQRIVTYCNMHHPRQSRGEHAAVLLSAEGFQALALAGGYPAWHAAGLPSDTGSHAAQ